MRIVIDMQGSQTESRFRGIGRYSLSLAQAIVRHADGHEIWIVLNGCLRESIPTIQSAFEGLVPRHHIRIFHVPCGDNRSQWTIEASEIIREDFLESIQPNIVLVTSLFEGYWANAVTSIGAIETPYQTAVILYDLIPLLYKDVYLLSLDMQNYFYKKINWLRNADLVLAISESSRQECIEHIGTPQERIINISAAADPKFKAPPQSIVNIEMLYSKFGIRHKPILYVPGGVDPRKNFARLIEAYSLLAPSIRKQSQLVIASKMPALKKLELWKHATHFGLNEDELVLTDYLSDEELILLYSQAHLFVFPSTHEGFGLPLLEAMACGASAIGSNSSSIPEVIGFADALFDPKSAQSIADKITETFTNDEFRNQLKDNAQNRAQNFSWDNCAKTAIAAMESLIGDIDHAAHPRPSDNLIEALATATTATPTDSDLRQIANSISLNIDTKYL